MPVQLRLQTHNGGQLLLLLLWTVHHCKFFSSENDTSCTMCVCVCRHRDCFCMLLVRPLLPPSTAATDDDWNRDNVRFGGGGGWEGGGEGSSVQWCHNTINAKRQLLKRVARVIARRLLRFIDWSIISYKLFLIVIPLDSENDFLLTANSGLKPHSNSRDEQLTGPHHPHVLR